MSEKKTNQVLYSAVKEKIVELIKNEVYQPNTQLPTEAEFCRQFGVSRTTIRTALQQLSLEGYVYKQQGKGTFVANNKVKQTLTSTVEDFREQLRVQGKEPSIKVLNLEVIPADKRLSKMFQLEVGAPVNKLERIRYADDEPLQYEIAYLPWERTPGLSQEECEKSLYKLLATQFKLKIKKTVEQLELMMADEKVADILHTSVSLPCFLLETSAYLGDGTLIEFSKTVFRGDRANFVIERNYL